MKTTKKYRAVFVEKRHGAHTRVETINATSGVQALNMARFIAQARNIRLYEIGTYHG